MTVTVVVVVVVGGGGGDGYVFTWVCLSVSLFVCSLNYSKSYKRIMIKFVGMVGRGPTNNRLDFGGNPDYDPRPGTF